MSKLTIERLLLLAAHLPAVGRVAFELLVLAALVCLGCRYHGLLTHIAITAVTVYVGMTWGLRLALFVAARCGHE